MHASAVCSLFGQYFQGSKSTPGLDGIHGWVLKACASQLAEVFTHVFTLSPILVGYKSTTIVPVLKAYLLNKWLVPYCTDLHNHEVLQVAN